MIIDNSKIGKYFSKEIILFIIYLGFFCLANEGNWFLNTNRRMFFLIYNSLLFMPNVVPIQLVSK